MAFTESQIIQAGGAVNNNKSVQAATQQQAPNPANVRLQNVSYATANYEQSVSSEKISMYGGINSSNINQNILQLQILGNQIHSQTSQIKGEENSFKASVKSTEKQNFSSISGYSGMDINFYKSFGFIPRTLDSEILINQNGTLSLTFNPLLVPKLSSQYNSIEGQISQLNAETNKFNTLLTNIQNYSNSLPSTAQLLGSNPVSSPTTQQTNQFISFMQNVVKGQGTTISYPFSNADSLPGPAYVAPTSAGKQFLSNMGTLGSAAGLGSVLQAVNSGSTSKIVAAVKKNAITSSNFQKASNNFWVQSVVSSQLTAANKESTKLLEDIGIIAAATGAAVVTFGAAAPITGAIIGDTLLGIGISDATAGGIATLGGAAAAGAISSVPYTTITSIGLSEVNKGKLPTAQSYVSQLGWNALIFGGMSVGSEVGITGLKSAYALLKGIPTAAEYSLPEFADTFGEDNAFYQNFMRTGINPAKASIWVNPKTEEPILSFYNDVNMGNGETSNDIFKSLASLNDKFGVLRLGTAARGTFTDEFIVNPAGESGNTILRGVRANIDLGTEGMYTNIPGSKGLPIFLNYVSIDYPADYTSLGSKSLLSSLKNGLLTNPFKAYSTFGTVEADIEDFGTHSLNEVENAIGESINSPEGTFKASNYLDWQAAETGSPLRYATQNFKEGGSEIQTMLKVGDVVKADNTQEYLFVSKGFFPKMTFANMADFEITGTGGAVSSAADLIRTSSESSNLILGNGLYSSSSSEATFFSGSSLVDPLVSEGSTNYRGISKISSSKINFLPSSSGLIGSSASISPISSIFSGSSFLSSVTSSFPSEISSASSKSSLYKSVSSGKSSLSGSSMLSDISSVVSSKSSVFSSSYPNNSSSSIPPSDIIPDNYWFRHGFPFGFLNGGKSNMISDIELGMTADKYTPSLGAAVFNIRGNKKTEKKQNSRGGVLNSFFRPVLT